MSTLPEKMTAFLAAPPDRRLTWGAPVPGPVESAFLDAAVCILSGCDEPVTRCLSRWIATRSHLAGAVHQT